jgi:hypothetical protein
MSRQGVGMTRKSEPNPVKRVTAKKSDYAF